MTDSSEQSGKIAMSPLRAAVYAAGLVAVFATYIYVYGVTVPAVSYCVLAVLLLLVALIDAETYTIPNIYVVGISMLFFVMVCVETIMGAPMTQVVAQVTDGLLGSLVVGGGMLLFSVVFDLVTGRMSLGGGDIKLLLAVNLFLGLQLSIANLVLSCIFALIFAAVTGKQKKEGEDGSLQRVIPFGPGIALATVLSLAVGPLAFAWLGLAL